MKTTIMILVIIFILYIFLTYEPIKEQTTEKLTAPIIEHKQPELILYYSSQCGHCHDFLKNGWKQLHDNPIDVKLIEFDCDKYECKNIDVYPTIILFKNDKIVSYNGTRTYEDLKQFISNS